MQNLLERLRPKYNLNLGEVEFSPIMQSSIGLAMLHYENQFSAPLHFSFPRKHMSALWLAMGLLRNYFLSDYINQAENRIEELGLEPNDKIKVFGSKAQFLGYDGDNIRLQFKNGTNVKTKRNIAPFINRNDGKSLNTYKHYCKKRQELKNNRDSVSKMIEPDDSIIINQKILTSKIFVIAGRGNTKVFRNYLKNNKVYDSTFSEVFNMGSNLIIRPDLETQKFISQTSSNDEKIFEEAFLYYINDLIQAIPQEKNTISDLKDDVENQNYRTQEFINKYDEILDLITGDTTPRIYRVREKYPGIKEGLPSELKAVVINDIDQVSIYRKTIEEYIRRNIPVYIVSDRSIKGKKDLSVFTDYFEKYNSDLRINWSRKKISELIKAQKSEDNFLDNNLWDSCSKFKNQTITIIQSPEHPLDYLIKQISTEISKVEGFERLKEAYWKYFNPFIYTFKNGNKWREYNEKLVSAFEQVHNQLEVTINPHLNSLFQKAIEAINNNKDNFKNLNDYENIFIQSFSFKEEQYDFPEFEGERSLIFKIDSDINKITFPGFPLNEPIGRFLVSGISEYHVPHIDILCWPTEGKLTYNYVKRRLKAGYFIDNVPEEWGVEPEILLQNDEDINTEVDSMLIYGAMKKTSIVESITDEIELEKISEFKYSGYTKTDEPSEGYLVSCNIIDFTDGSFMFLPKNSSVLARIEFYENPKKVKKAKFKDLNVGDEVFEYQVSRHDLRELTKDVEGSEKIYNTLDIWKESLTKTYLKCSEDIQLLSNLLKKTEEKHSIGANPTRQNIRRWLFDDDMLSPEKENLSVILLADEDNSKVNMLPQILDAFTKAKNLSGQVSRKIKTAIINKLKNLNNYDDRNFIIEISGYNIKIQYKTIVYLQDKDVEIDYSQSRKFVN